MKTTIFLIFVMTANTAFSQVPWAVKANSPVGLYLQARGGATSKMAASQDKIKEELTAWKMGQSFAEKLDAKTTFAFNKIGVKNTFKAVLRKAKKEKVEFENIFALGFMKTFYSLNRDEIEPAAKTLNIKTELQEIVSVLTYLDTYESEMPFGR